MSKNIIILVDGTWQSEDSIFKTNIYKLREMLPPSQKDQIFYYQNGVGTQGGVDKVWGGMTGFGINKHILSAYAFLVKHYKPGDKIFLFGFSRGAYTVRSLAGMIYNVSILKSSHAKHITQGFHLYRSDVHPNTDKKATQFIQDYCHDRDKIIIQFLGVYDSVGVLGIPIKLFKPVNYAKYRFHDTKLNKLVKIGCHALAIDEHRKDFKPSLWQAGRETNSQQRWFVGSHSDVGGGYKDDQLSDVTLKWMLSNAVSCGLKLFVHHDKSLVTASNFEVSLHRLGVLPNCLGPLHDSRFSGKVLGLPIRSSYHRKFGQNKDEVLDPSVFERITTMGYQPKHLIESDFFSRYADRLMVMG